MIYKGKSKREGRGGRGEWANDKNERHVWELNKNGTTENFPSLSLPPTEANESGDLCKIANYTPVLYMSRTAPRMTIWGL